MSQKVVEGFRLSPQQRHLWEHLGSGKGSGAVARIRIGGDRPVDREALARALEAAVERHEILRTRFERLPGMEVPLQIIENEATASLEVHADPEAGEEEVARRAAETMASRARDQAGPLLAGELWTGSGPGGQLVLHLSALCTDPRSLALLCDEIGRLYTGSPVEEEPVQYADVSEWQNEVLDSEETAEGRRFWRRLDPLAHRGASLPFDRWEEPGRSEGEGADVPGDLEAPLPGTLLDRAAGLGEVPVGDIVATAWRLFLQRLAGNEGGFAVAVARPGRRFEDLAGALGLFARHLPVLFAVPPGSSFGDALGRAREALVEVDRWQECYGAGDLPRPGENEDSSFAFGFADEPLPGPFEAGGVSFQLADWRAPLDRSSLLLTLRRPQEGAPSAGGASLLLRHDPRRLDRAEAAGLLNCFRVFLTDALERPGVPISHLALVGEEEERRLIEELNRTGRDFGLPQTLTGRFFRQAGATPEAVALVWGDGAAGDEVWSYAHLAARARALAARLADAGVGPEDRVALCIERSPAMLVGIFGILRAGAAYVSLDPEYPAERLNYMLADSDARWLVTRRALLTGKELGANLDSPVAGPGGLECIDLDDPAADSAPDSVREPPHPEPDHAAYIIYTSGSTGRPKGVVVAHQAILNRLLWIQAEFPMQPGDALLQKTPYSFDASIWEITVPLFAGARLVLARPGGHRNAEYLVSSIAWHRVTVLQLVPSQLPTFLNEAARRQSSLPLLRLFCGGEALPADTVRRAMAELGVSMCNLYGPTEASIDATFRALPPEDVTEGGPCSEGIIPIGRPLANARVMVLDERLNPLPQGIPGELFLGGTGLARGYHRRPALTAGRFLPDPFAGRGESGAGERLYRTGDRVRLSPPGHRPAEPEVEFLGRIDQQVKLRGFRIEPGEVEEVLRRYPALEEAVVVVREDLPGDPRLVGYAVPRAERSPGGGELYNLPEGLRVACLNPDETDVVYREVFRDESYLVHGIELHPGAVVFDVGANIGLFALFMEERFPGVRLYCFEPIPRTFEALRTNVGLYGLDARIFQAGVGAEPGDREFIFYPRWSSMSGAHARPEVEEALSRAILRRQDPSLAEHADDLLAGRFVTETVRSPVLTLSQVLRDEGVERIDLLKIDVEKAEEEVLAGLAEEDWRRVAQLVVEVHDEGGRLGRVRDQMEARGYRVTVDQDPLLADTDIYNLYAVHPDRRRPGTPPADRRLTLPEASPEALRSYLAGELPEHMVPSAVVLLGKLPRLPNGKLDRASLPAPEGPEAPDSTAPRNPAEEILCSLWAGLFDLPGVGIDQSFFDLGGHSILATRLIARVREIFAAPVNVRDLFQNSTVRDFAALVEASGQGDFEEAPALLPLADDERGGDLPLSLAQRRLWFLARLEPASTAYHLPSALRLRGHLDLPALARAFDALVERHEALRTTFPERDGDPVQRIGSPAPVRLARVDLDGLPPAAGEDLAREIFARQVRRPFDLATGPLLRVLVLKLPSRPTRTEPAAAEHYQVLLDLHHIVGDGWSTGVLIREITALYRAFHHGRATVLPPLPIQVADHAAWQRRWLSGSRLEEQVVFWRRYLHGAGSPPELPADGRRGAGGGRPGAELDRVLSPELTEALAGLARGTGTTPFMVLLAGLALLLSRLTGEDDLVLGTPIANRDRSEVEGLIGCFLNTLAIRVDLQGNPSVRVLLERVRSSTLETYAHRDLPFEEVIEAVAPDRDLARHPIFEVMLNFINNPRETLELPDLELELLDLAEVEAKFPLTLYAFEMDGRLFLQATYRSDLFSRDRMAVLLAQLEGVLEQMVEAPERHLGELSLLTPESAAWHADPSAPLPAEDLPTLPDTFAARVEEGPDRAALHQRTAEGGTVVWSYGAVHGRARRLARGLGLREAGEAVAVHGLRCPAFYLAMLGVLEAGGVVVPLDAALPPGRKVAMLAAAAVRRVVEIDVPESEGAAALAGGQLTAPFTVLPLDPESLELPGAAPEEPASQAPLRRPRPGDSAYIFFTSGTTGQPRAVEGEHRGLAHFLAWEGETFEVGPGDRVAQLTGLSFDVMLRDVFVPLSRGATLYVPPPELLPDRVPLWLREAAVTLLHAVPAVADSWLAETSPGLALPALRWTLFAGESLSDALVSAWRRAFPGTAIGNLYGPTETTLAKCCFVVPPTPLPGVQPVGRPLPGCQALVLPVRDGEDGGELGAGPPRGVGEVGEIVLRTPYRTRGYRNDPEAQGRRFVPNPYRKGAEEDPSDRLYRTGDLGRWRPEGNLEILGRLDHEVKVRGVRVEPAAITALLRAHDGVAVAAVVACRREGAGRSDSQTDSSFELDAFLVPRTGAALDGPSLRAYLSRHLPAAMIPGSFHLREALPRLPNGKIDLRRLADEAARIPAREADALALGREPRTAVEALLAGIWEEVLGVATPGSEDDFFRLGGHSLLATRVLSRIRECLGVELPLVTLFEAPLLGTLAREVETRRRAESGVETAPLAPRALPAGDGFQRQAPLSFAQQRLWFIEQLRPSGASYNLPAALELGGDLDPRRLAAALGDVLRRQQALRTTFVAVDNQPVQRVVPGPAEEAELPRVDLGGLPVRIREGEARRLLDGLAGRPFDLAAGSGAQSIPLRALLLRLAPRRHRLGVVVHHIAADLWSLSILAGETAAFYARRSGTSARDLPPLPVQYPDFAVWQREWLRGEALERRLAFWRRHLAGAPTVLDLPLDRPRPPLQSQRGRRLPVAFSGAESEALKACCRRRGVTPFMLLLASYGALLSRFSGARDLIVGTPVAGRSRPEIEGLIGLFVNTLALRVDLRGRPGIRALLDQMRETTLAAQDHQDLPFERLLDELAVERDLSRPPVFQVMLALHNLPRDALSRNSGEDGESAPKELTLTPLPVETGASKFDLLLSFVEDRLGFTGALEYSPDLHDPSTARRFANGFHRLALAFLRDEETPVETLPLLAPAEEHQLLREWNDTAGEAPATDLATLILARARRCPDAVALAGDGAAGGGEGLAEALSFAALERRATALAARLAAEGVGPESVVGVAMERSIERVVALVAVLLAGGAYLPLDPEYPAERLAWMVDEALVGAGLVLVDRRRPGAGGQNLAAALESRPVRTLDVDLDALARETGPAYRAPALHPTSPAYALYTSGSTGRPKGVVNTHSGIVNRLLWMQDHCRLSPGDRVLQKTPYTFDVSVWELFLPLITGARLEVARPGVHRDPEALVRTVAERRITVIHFVPTMLEAFLDAPGLAGCSALRRVVASGEALEGGLAARFRSRLAARLDNLYGPTEAAVDVTVWPALPEAGEGDAPEAGAGVPLGRPITNLRIHLLDSAARPVPLGAAGELAIAGVGLARGYLRRPALTAERYVPDPGSGEPGGRVYRTGDLVRRRGDGVLEFLGRVDHQVKVRGVRIELGEVEAVLATHPAVARAVVKAVSPPRQDRSGASHSGSGRLIAYLVPVPGAAAPPVEALREHLGRRLPEPMIPAAFVTLADLPTTPSGKVDRRALPDPDGELRGERPELAGPFVAPRDETEETLAGIWSQVLGVERVGIHDPFFALGGDSILSIQVVGMARDRGLELELTELFQHPTVAGVARVARHREEAGAVAVAPFALLGPEDRALLPGDAEDAYPMTRMQTGMVYHGELEPDDPLFHNLNGWTLEIDSDADLFRLAVERLVLRHPILRTSLHLTGFSEPLQVVHRDVPLPLSIQDLRHLDPADREEAIREGYRRERERRFDFTRAPLIRLRVLLLGEGKVHFAVTEHHSILDGWSLLSLLTELFNDYLELLAARRRGGPLPEPRPPVPVGYRDYVALEQQALSSQEARSYWRGILEDFTPRSLPRWPAPRRRPGQSRIERRIFSLEPEVRRGLEAVARAAAVPIKNVLMAAHLKILEALGGSPDVMTGLVTNGRPERTGGQEIAGLFLNVLPLRVHLDPGSWKDLVRQAFDAERRLLPHRRFPLANLQQAFGRQRIFDIEFNFVHFHVAETLARDSRLEVLSTDGEIEQTDMTVAAAFQRSAVSGEIDLSLRYRTDRLAPEQVDLIVVLYRGALAALATEPDARHDELAESLLPALTLEFGADFPGLGRLQGPEVPALLPETSSHPRAFRGLAGLFEARAAAWPGAEALLTPAGERLTYGELDARACRLAAALHRRGAGPAAPVALLAGRSLDLLIASLAALKIGAPYLVLDPASPAARLEAQLADSAARLLLLDRSGSEGPAGDLKHLAGGLEVLIREELTAAEPAGGRTAPEPIIPPESIAYFAYTSGSTGRPKGVPATHRGVWNYVTQLVKTWEIGPGDTVLQLAAPTFDASVRESLGALAAGGRLLLTDPGEDRKASRLVEALERHGVTAVLSIVPSLLRALLATAGEKLPRLRLLLSSGEPLHRSDLEKVWKRFGPGVRVVNLYGPTECTLTTTFKAFSAPEPASTAPERSGVLAAGRPIANARLEILDRRLRPVLSGVSAQIFLAGPGLSPGYAANPRSTARAFPPDPRSGLDGVTPGSRIYATGDLGFLDADGDLELLGRLDRQVKLRGMRLELDEIEGAVAAHPGVRSAVARLDGDPTGGSRLVAYYTSGEEAVGAEALRRFLAELLPAPFIPSVLVPLDEMPRLPNGKIDRAALPRIAGERPELERLYVAPRNDLERRLAELWSEVLGVEEVGVEDDFFALGGHSLAAVRLIARVREVFAVELPLARLFEASHVAGLARAVNAAAAGPAVSDGPTAGDAREEELLARVDEMDTAELDTLLDELMEEGGPMDGEDPDGG